jgi:RecA-family ATPase
MTTIDELNAQAAAAENPATLQRFSLDNLGARPRPVPALLTRDSAKGPVAWLPLGTVAFLSATGGVGKSQLVAQLAVSVATGRKWVGTFEVAAHGPVCWWAGEDEAEDVLRRIHPMNLTDAERARVSELVHVSFANGKDARFLDRGTPTAYFAGVLAEVERVQPVLVILDPGSRFMGIDENDNAQATAWISLVERLKNVASKPTVLVAVHQSKPGQAKGGDALETRGQGATRGASAFVDGARWQANLERRSRDGDPFDVLVLERTKNNRTPPDAGAILLERGEGGVLTHASNGAEAWVKASHEGEAVSSKPKGKKSKKAEQTPDWIVR